MTEFKALLDGQQGAKFQIMMMANQRGYDKLQVAHLAQVVAQK